MYQTRNDVEKRLIQMIASGDSDARRSYAAWLNERGESERAAFLHLDRAVLHAPWRAALDEGWLNSLEVEWIRALGHEALQFSTWDTAVPPSQNVQITVTVRAAHRPFRPQHLLISAKGTPRGTADWAVNDLRIGYFSQFYQSGDVSGDVFATPEIDRYVAFKERLIVPPTEVTLTVTYVGSKEEGTRFCAWLVGSLEP